MTDLCIVQVVEFNKLPTGFEQKLFNFQQDMIKLKKMKIQVPSNRKTSPKLTELMLANWKKILETKLQYHYF